MPEPTPTVIESDRKIAEEWYRCPSGTTHSPACSPTHALELDRMAAEIAAAREAWGAPREAVAALVDLVAAAIRDHEDRAGECPITAPSDPDEPCLYDRLRAALERVKGVGA